MRAREADPVPEPVEHMRLATFADVVALAAARRDLPIKSALECDVRLVRMEDGRLELNLEPAASRGLAHDLSRKLSQWTGRRWVVVISAEEGAPTLRSQAQDAKEELTRELHADPRVKAVMERFPGATIVDVRRIGGAAESEEIVDGIVDEAAEDFASGLD